MSTHEPTAMVFTPSPLLTVTVETRPDGEPDIHLHPGGQGVWIARMMASLGASVQLCAPFGGETGKVLVGLIESARIRVHPSVATGSNGAYVHDRRDGHRQVVATANPAALHRHEFDELVNRSLVHGLDADVVLLGGPDGADILPAVAYQRLAGDLHGRGVRVIADLSGEPMTAALAGRVSVLKTSHDDLVKEGRTNDTDVNALVDVMRQLAAEGAETVIVSRATDPTLVLHDGTALQVQAPTFTTVDHRGAGDSLTAGVAVALSRGQTLEQALQLGAAAGALNATRHGLGTGQRQLIERLAVDVRIEAL